MNRIQSFIILLFCALVISCGKDNGDRIPDVPVNLVIPKNDPRLSRLNAFGGAVAINGHGVAGIILYKRLSGGRIVAYDRCSSVNPIQKCQVRIDEPTITASDTCSNNIVRFSLEDGSRIEGEGGRPLKQYSVIDDGNIISVIN